MGKPVYKTETGRNIVESMYRNLLATYSTHLYDQLFVPTAVARTHVLRFGDQSKPPLVMLHGSVSNSAAWLGNISDFVDQFCIYCIDIPGEPGLSEPVRCTLASEEPYAWLSSLLGNLGIDEACFVSMSLGGWYALNFAVHSPEKVRALSMITTGGIVPAKTSFLFKAVLYMMLGKRGQNLLNQAVFHKAEVPAEVLEFQAVTTKHFNPMVEAIPVFSDAQLKRLTMPLQFFGGDHDALIDSVKTGERLKKLLPRAEIHILQDTGHVIIDQFPVIREFLLANRPVSLDNRAPCPFA